MFENQGSEGLRRLFADQFEADGDGFLYRKSSKSAPIRVSATERDRYIAWFNKFLKCWHWGIIGGIVLLCVAGASYIFDVGSEPSDLSTWIGVAAILAISLIALYWALSVPARELHGRGTVGTARSRTEMQRRYFEKLTYGELVLPVGAAAFLLFKVGSKGNPFAGWNSWWLALGVLILVATVVQAFRKWCFDSRQKVAGKPPARG